MKLMIKTCLLILTLLILYFVVTQIATLLYQRHYNRITLIRAKQVVTEMDSLKKETTSKPLVGSNNVEGSKN
jgi:expansin (peptidoglycan-binding protein)